MKKSLSLILVLMVGLFFVVGFHFAFAGDECAAMKSSSGDAKVTDAKATGDKASCAKTCAEAKTASAGGGCPMAKMASATSGSTDESKTAEAKSSGCPMARMAGEKTAGAKCCDHEGKCADLTLNIKGMTCTGCESKITEALKADPGVLKVVSIDYKTGQAVVCYDPAKVESSKLLGLVSGAGYQAEVIPAAAKSGEMKKGMVCDMTGKCTKAKTAENPESH